MEKSSLRRNKSSGVSLSGIIWVGVMIALLIVSFITGTMVGFKTAMKQLSGCEQVSCSALGIDDPSIQSCDLCVGKTKLWLG